MSITIQLLGRPRITRGTAAGYKLRSRKSWGLLAYLILSERPATRGQLASLLFAQADDPVRALRWCLAEIRRALGDEGSVDGDPVVTATALQRLMVEDAIGRRLEITVWRNGALVDVIAYPRELLDA